MPQIAGTNYANIVLRAIRNKIIGPANEVLNMYGISIDWTDIKNNLVVHYADKRNETSLIRDLHQLRQGVDSVEVFYAKIIEILSTIMNHVRLHEKEATLVAAKKTLYEEMCLNSFLSGLREPFGSTIRAMRPSKFTEALSFCLEEQNRFYFHGLQNFQRNPQTRSNRINEFSSNPRPTIMAPQVPYKAEYRYSHPTPIRPPQTFSSTNLTPFKQNYNRQNTPGTHNYNTSQSVNNNTNTPFVKPSTSSRFYPPPEPMSVSNAYTQKQSANHPQSKTQQLHNIETNYYTNENQPLEQESYSESTYYPNQNTLLTSVPQQNHYDYYQCTNNPPPLNLLNEAVVDDANFHLPASENL